jgi:hypothetical protein
MENLRDLTTSLDDDIYAAHREGIYIESLNRIAGVSKGKHQISIFFAILAKGNSSTQA